jgi:hypothetical protein
MFQDVREASPETLQSDETLMVPITDDGTATQIVGVFFIPFWKKRNIFFVS